MAQSATTVTTSNPSPPTNLSSTGATPPNPATFDPQIYVNTGTGLDGLGDLHYPRPNLAPYFDDGTTSGGVSPLTGYVAPGTATVFATKTAALLVGGTSVDNEGKGSETVVTATSANPGGLGQMTTFSCLGNFTGVANPTTGVSTSATATHASSLSPAVNPTFTSFTAGSSVSGVGTTTLSCVTVGATKQSVVYVNGVAQTTVFVSAVSLTCAAVTKKTTAGNWDIKIVTGGVVETAPRTWTFS